MGKGKDAAHPFLGWIVYGPRLHEKEERSYVVLYQKDTKDKICISYARYIMQVHLGRRLLDREHVDHIDNNGCNDVISNLQILSPEDNYKKFVSEILKPTLAELVCPVCNNVFYIKKSNVTKNRACGKACANIKRAAATTRKKKISDITIARIKDLRESGLTCDEIHRIVGVARNTVMRYWK